METQIWFPPACSVGGELSKGTIASSSTSAWEKAAHPTLTPKPDNSVLPICPWHAFLATVPAQELRSSESECLCRPLNKNDWDSRSSLSHSVTIPTGFHSKKLWGLLFQALELQPGEDGVELGPLTPQRTPLAAKISLPVFNCHRWMWVQPSYQSQCVFLLISFILGPPLSYISGSSE